KGVGIKVGRKIGTDRTASINRFRNLEVYIDPKRNPDHHTEDFLVWEEQTLDVFSMHLETVESEGKVVVKEVLIPRLSHATREEVRPVLKLWGREAPRMTMRKGEDIEPEDLFLAALLFIIERLLERTDEDLGSLSLEDPHRAI
ncbi:hypothetical protein PMAYCL1PPCAC_22712, partial [Pristionchus mayeri]